MSKNSPSASAHTASPSKGKLSGKFSWPFALTMPAEVEVKYQRVVQRCRLPASFYVRGARVTIRYQVCAIVARGKLQVNGE